MSEESGASVAPRGLVRRLGLFDATMIVMGGIIGSGIFVNPAEVARHVGSPGLIVGAWLIGGIIALIGALVYAELAARRPETGGQYAYLRDAWGPVPAFLYGWSLLLVIQSGGMAAVAIIFARYVVELTLVPVPEPAIAAGALAMLTAINCLGVRAGSNVQNVLMVLKIGVIAALVLAGFLLAPAAPPPTMPVETAPLGLLAALTPVMFAYGGWQTASFISGEMRDPRRDLARGLLLGVGGVVLLYAAVAFVCVHALGPQGLAEARAPASAVMRLALGERGADLLALGIAISALGFLSQGMLTTPRVYFAMAADGLFFRQFGEVDARTHVPVFAILLQGAAAMIIALSGTFAAILSYVVSVDFLWFGLTGAALIAFRRGAPESAGFSVPGHPFTTITFVASCWLIVAATVWNDPRNSAIGYAILLAGMPACLYWLSRRRTQ
jgi:APA family basic amino acid/polyamine antiporter